MTVWLLTIEHRHGTDHWVCATREIAEANLDNYVRTWWEEEIDDKPMPATADERIQQYFDEMADASHPEYYTIEEHQVLADASLNKSLLEARE